MAEVRLEQGRYDGRLVRVMLSPDGERVLFCSKLTAGELYAQAPKANPAAAREPKPPATND